MIHSSQSVTHQSTSARPGDEIYEGFHVNYAAAPLGKRILAYCIDLGIIYGLLYVSFILLLVPLAATVGVAGSALKNLEGMGTITVVGIVVLLTLGIGLIYHGYFIYQEAKQGTTIGKRVFGLRVISEDGQRLSINQCVIRDLMRYIDAALIFPGLIAMIASDRNRRLGDMLCNTLVVYSKSQEASNNFIYMQQQDYFLWADKLGAKPTPPSVCQDFLSLAYPMFITGERPLDLHGEEKQFWLECLHHFLPQGPVAGLNTLELQQFFAEHCNQQIISHHNRA